MDYRKFGDTVYIRMDIGDEIIGGVIRRKYDEETGTGFWDFE